MCMGKLYAHANFTVLIGDADEPNKATSIVQSYVDMWEKDFKDTWSGDFYWIFDGWLHIYTQEAQCPVVWRRVVP